MDIIYHGSCMDGAFSSFTMFVFLNLLKYRYKDKYKSTLNTFMKKLVDKEPIAFEEVEIDSKNPLIQMREEFFMYDKENKFTSIMPGSFNNGLINYIKKSGNNSYVCLVDCYGEQAELIESLCEKYDHVFIIDHHISGVEVVKKVKAKNLTYVFDEDMCGFQLVVQFLETNFHFDKMCPEKFTSWLKVFKSYIRKNDLKLDETLESKQFVLGFYHFNYIMSDTNFQIYKQLANLDINYILDKGKKLYPHHRAKLLQYASQPSQVRFAYKNKKYEFIAIKTSQSEYISDLGIILSELACRNGLQNLAMFYRYAGDIAKVSFRSRRGKPNPRALEMAQLFGGGGHLCAAGCQIKKQIFMNNFEFKAMKNIEVDIIEELLFESK